MENATTRQLLTCLFAVAIGLTVFVLGGCADVERMHPMLKRTLDDNQKWSGGGP